MALQYDPNNPVYPEPTKVNLPTLEQPTSQVNAKTGASYIDPTKTSSSIAANMISKDSPFRQAAETVAKQQGNKMGLLNSAMTASAGTKAAVETAQPFALQDAQLYGQTALNQQQTDNTGALNQQVAQLDTTKAKNNAALTGALNEQALGNTMKLEGFKYPMQKELAQMGYDTQKQIAMASAINSQTNTMMSIVGTLLNNTDIEMGDNVTKWVSDYMNNSWQSLGELFGIPISVV